MQTIRPQLLPVFYRLLVVAAIQFSMRTSSAQNALNYTMQVTAATSANPPYITLSWPAISSASGNISIWRRVKGTSSMGTAVSIPATSTSYADPSAIPGIAYDYSLQCPRSTAPTIVYGAIVGGVNIPLVEKRGNVVLLVDNTLAAALAPEIEQLEKNLLADGWTVFRHDVPRQSYLSTSNTAADNAKRAAEIPAIRSIIQSDYNSYGGSSVNWALFILGHVPVPYSGSIVPDGHSPGHTGAWATDTYYADIDGNWTDSTVNTGTTGRSYTNTYNVPGDGKFDQSTLPSDVEMGCGRVDLSSMASVPTGLSEVDLMRQYLVRDHRFRRKLPPFDAVAKRGLVDDNFSGSEAFSSSGWRTGFAWFGRGAGQMDALDWFGTLGTTPMLLAYGCGGGSTLSCGGVGTSNGDFNKKDSKAVFTMLFGSWFGDWDMNDNILRAPLAGTANSLGLTSVWSGRPYFNMLHMALGDTIGNCARFSQNFSDSTYSGGWSNNGFMRYVSINLMGDPTLRLHVVTPPSGVSATTSTGGITVTWTASPESNLSGYHIYRSTGGSGVFTRITGAPADASNPTGSCLGTATLSFTDADTTLLPGTSYTYMVKAVRMESSGSGSYANQSIGEAVTVTHQAVGLAAPSRLSVSRTSATTCVLVWDDNAADETGYLIERFDPSTATWAQIASVAASTHTDTAAPSGQIAQYRVRASGNAGTSEYSNIAADYNLPGLIYTATPSYVFPKTAGSAAVPFTRFNGSSGDVGITCATSSVLATAGTDYTATTGPLAWNHGISGTALCSVPVANLPAPQETKIFKVTASNPTGGAALNTPSGTFVFINDPDALTLPSPWSTSTIGNIASGQAGYAQYITNANGGAFDLVCTSDYVGTGLNDSYRLVTRSVTGDFQFTARVFKLPTALNSNMYGGIMVRNSLTNSASAMAGILRIANSGAHFFNRATDGGSLADSAGPWLSGAVWLRLVRSGNTLSGSYSSNNVTWTALPSATVTLNASVYLGMALSSNYSGTPAYAQFDNLSLYTVPGNVATLTASTAAATQSGQIRLSWTSSSAATSYNIERSTTSGANFVQIATTADTTYIDGNLTPGTTYFYRIKAANPVFGSASYSPQASAVPFIAANSNGWRYTHFGSESATGNAAPLASPAGDGISNLMKYAMGLDPHIASTASRLSKIQQQEVGGDNYLTFTFVHNTMATDVACRVEAASDMLSAWDSIDPLSPANQLAVLPDTPSTGLETITVKDTRPVGFAPKRFMRLRVTSP